MTDRIVIAGAGQAGGQAAQTLRQKGFSGAIDLVGAEPLLPYERPPLSKAYLKGETTAERLLLRQRAFYDEREIALHLGDPVIAIDRAAGRVTLASGRALPYDKLLLATGASPIVPDLPGRKLAGVLSLRSLADADALRPRLESGAPVGIVGGGYIGLEVASAARSAGCPVTVLDIAERLMARSVSPETSAYFLAAHRSQGVDVRLSCPAQALTAHPNAPGRVGAVVPASGARVAAETVVIGVGVRPETALGEAAGLDIDDGIIVDETGRTSDPAIFAAGDCTRHPNCFAGGMTRLESVQNAVDQAKTAAAAMLGEPARYDAVPWFWSDQAGQSLRIVGLAQPGDSRVLRGDPATGSFSVIYLRDGAVTAVEAVNRMRDFTQGRRLVAERRRVEAGELADAERPLKTLAAAGA